MLKAHQAVRRISLLSLGYLVKKNRAEGLRGKSVCEQGQSIGRGSISPMLHIGPLRFLKGLETCFHTCQSS